VILSGFLENLIIPPRAFNSKKRDSLKDSYPNELNSKMKIGFNPFLLYAYLWASRRICVHVCVWLRS